LKEPLEFGSTIGIMGGGQLGRMLAMSAAKMGYKTHVYDPGKDPPAAQVCNRHTQAEFNNLEALRQFSNEVDAITFEFENVDVPCFEVLDSHKVSPNLNAIGICQDRIQEKSFIMRCGPGTAEWRSAFTLDHMKAAFQELSSGEPLLAKTSRLGYDGKGQMKVDSLDDCERVWMQLDPNPLILEKIVDFTHEISVVAARDHHDNVELFEVTENVHKGGILHTSSVPARIKAVHDYEARRIATVLIRELKIVGLLAVEMFVTRDERVIVNELAPRPHNSGHWTLDACDVSQFDQHIRSVTGWGIHCPQRHSNALMMNLIGPDDMTLVPKLMVESGVILHLYGKREAKMGRKMGHVSRLGPKIYSRDGGLKILPS
jgi:5-(carboxyamino)imidazole ribonucleotide synthase